MHRVAVLALTDKLVVLTVILDVLITELLRVRLVAHVLLKKMVVDRQVSVLSNLMDPVQRHLHLLIQISERHAQPVLIVVAQEGMAMCSVMAVVMPLLLQTHQVSGTTVLLVRTFVAKYILEPLNVMAPVLLVLQLHPSLRVSEMLVYQVPITVARPTKEQSSAGDVVLQRRQTDLIVLVSIDVGMEV